MQVGTLSPSSFHIDGHDYSSSAVLEALNYGINPLFSKISSVWCFREEIRKLYCVWDLALLIDLEQNVFPSSPLKLSFPGFDVGESTIAGKPSSFMRRRLAQEMRVFYNILLQYGHLYGEQVASGKRIFPHSYLINSVIRFVKFLRHTLKSGVNINDLTNTVDFFEESKDFWATTLGGHPFLSTLMVA